MLTGHPAQLLTVPVTDPTYAEKYAAIKALLAVYEQHCPERVLQLDAGRHIPTAALRKIRMSLYLALEAFDRAASEHPTPPEAEPS
jgi:hypothetical protein